MRKSHQQIGDFIFFRSVHYDRLSIVIGLWILFIILLGVLKGAEGCLINVHPIF